MEQNYSASALYAGGWRSEDIKELKEGPSLRGAISKV